jgi:outer membrane protein OmpA-like peptidoglycan-associated protein/tetratricopeptide (TPR) repeat protein
MKNKTIFLVLIIFCFGSIQISAQIKQANLFFEQFKYSKAVPLYKKEANSKEEKIKEEATVRLADCYRLMNNASEASLWYTKASEFNEIDPINYYYLGMSLRSLARYDEAEKAFLIYAEKVPSDLRGKNYAQYCHDIKQWTDLTPSADIKNAALLNSIYSDFGPMFFNDGLIFTSDRDIDMMEDKNYLWTNFGYLDLYLSKPISPKDFWNGTTIPEKLSSSFNQPYHDGPISFTSDFKEIFTTRTLKNKTKKDSSNIYTNYLKIFFADLSDDKKVNYKAFPYNDDSYSVGHPAISGDGKRLIFSMSKPGGLGQSDLYISELNNGTWSEPLNLGSDLNTFGNEVFPFFANDSTLFFSSDGHPGFGGLDIYESILVKGKWTAPWNLKLPLNSTYDDFSIVFNKELTEGFFSSNRPEGKGSDDIYTFKNYRRTPVEPNPLASISGYVKDKQTMLPLDSATVFLLNTVTKEVLVIKTNQEGYFEAPITKGTEYLAKAMKFSYFDDCLNFNIFTGEPSLKLNIPHDLMLGKYSLNQVFVVDNIYYDLDKWVIRDDAKPSLDKLVNLLKQNPINVEIGSHTDSRASSKYNNELSQKRADAAVKYLIENGIEASRLTYKGYGENMLINKCADGVTCSDADHQANRRTEFKITSINTVSDTKNIVNPDLFKNLQVIKTNDLNDDFFEKCIDR